MLENRFRELLQDEFADRCRRNARYSLRAFARDLEVEPASLSRVLNGKQGLSAVSARTIAEKIFSSPKKQRLFVTLAEYSSVKNSRAKSRLLGALSAVGERDTEVNLSLETFKVISDWYHIAIMDLLTLENAPRDSRKIASAIGISTVEAKIAIDRLLTLGLVRKLKDGRLEKVQAVMKSPHRVPSPYLRKFHRAMIEKANASLETQAPERRTITGVTMALAKEDLERVNQMIDEFKFELLELTKSTKPKEKLYQMNIQFFDLLLKEKQ